MTTQQSAVAVYPVRVDSETYTKVKALAAKEDLSAAQFIRRAVRRELAAIEAQTGNQQN